MKPYEGLTYEEKLACISLYPEEAKKDSCWCIRQEAYRALGYTEEAKKDSDGSIRKEAELYFKVLNDNNLSGKEVEVKLDGKVYKAIIK